MKIEHIHNGIRYTLSNEDLKVNDKVYPIARGRCLDDGSWILSNFNFRDYEFPNDPHTIKDLHYSNEKSYEIRTDMGYGPIDSYYKIIKRERQIKHLNITNNLDLSTYSWEEIKED